MVATVLDRFPKPPCAELLGWHVVAARPKEGWIRIGFQGRPEFANPAGFIQGGFLAAMLDDTMGPAAVIMKRSGFRGRQKENGTIVARATSTARIVPTKKLPARAAS